MTKDSKKDKKHMSRNEHAGFAFFLTYMGALVYFVDKANGFWEVAFSFLQALVWPALLINKIFTMLQI